MDGRYVARIWSFRDITERSRAAEKQRESSEKLDLVIDNIPQAVFWKDRQSVFLGCNSAFAKSLGFDSPADVVGKTDYDFSATRQEAEFYRECDRRIMDSDSAELGIEESLHLPDGSTAILNTNKVPLHDVEGSVVGVMATFEDITEREQAKAALHESEARFRELAELLPEAVFETDRNLGLTYANHRAYELFGYAETDLTQGMNGLNFIAPEDRERAAANIAKRRHGEDPGAVEYLALRKDGSTFPVLFHAASIAEEGELIGVRGVIVDITERKRAEEERLSLEGQLHRAQKLETIGTLAGGIAHDFNNILAPIMGYAEMALMRVEEKPAADDLAKILEAANRAKDLVQQILLFSKQTEKQRNPLKLQAVVKEALKLLRPSIPATVEIRQRIDDSCGRVRADATQMHQVIVNLCTNAWQTMQKQGGILTIELAQTEVDAGTATALPASVGREQVCLSVIDTGPGMDEKTLDRIFEPFFTTKAINEGTGLGLSVVHGIVEDHDGVILVNSELGKGTAFQIFLPTLQAEWESEQVETPNIVEGTESILLVDDEPAIVDVVRQMLESCGYVVDAFHTSIDALKAFREQPDKYDILVSDLTMPHMTGFDLSDELHKDRPQLPVMIMTGFGEKVTAATRQQHSIQQVVVKPVLLADLAAAVRNTIDN